MVAEKKYCSGSELHKGKLQSVDDCASICKGVASMFVFGTNEFGVNRCDSIGCKCFCETSAMDQGTCNQIDHNGYRLYKYITGYDHTLYNIHKTGEKHK